MVDDAGNPSQRFPDVVGDTFVGREVWAEDLNSVFAGLYPRDRFIDVVLDVLRVAEAHAWKFLREFVVDLFHEFRFGHASRPLIVRLQVDREFNVEKAGGLGAIVGATELRDDRGDLGETLEDRAHLIAQLGAVLE